MVHVFCFINSNVIRFLFFSFLKAIAISSHPTVGSKNLIITTIMIMISIIIIVIIIIMIVIGPSGVQFRE